jgi:hypothetical protein
MAAQGPPLTHGSSQQVLGVRASPGVLHVLAPVFLARDSCVSLPGISHCLTANALYGRVIGLIGVPEDVT